MTTLEDKANELVQATMSNPKLQQQIADGVKMMEAQGVTLYDVLMGDTIGSTMAIFLGGLDPEVATTLTVLQAKATRDSMEYRKDAANADAAVTIGG